MASARKWPFGVCGDAVAIAPFAVLTGVPFGVAVAAVAAVAAAAVGVVVVVAMGDDVVVPAAVVVVPLPTVPFCCGNAVSGIDCARCWLPFDVGDVVDVVRWNSFGRDGESSVSELICGTKFPNCC